MFAFLGSTIGRYIAMCVAILALLVGVYIFYLKYQNLKSANEILRYNQTQLEQNVKDKETYLHTLEEINKKKEAIIVDMQKSYEDLEHRSKEIITVIEKHPEYHKNKEASDLLKQTVRELSKGKGK